MRIFSQFPDAVRQIGYRHCRDHLSFYLAQRYGWILALKQERLKNSQTKCSSHAVLRECLDLSSSWNITEVRLSDGNVKTTGHRCKRFSKTLWRVWVKPDALFKVPVAPMPAFMRAAKSPMLICLGIGILGDYPKRSIITSSRHPSLFFRRGLSMRISTPDSAPSNEPICIE
jgi:hypothetical protein